MAFYRPGEAQREGDAVVDDRVDQAGGHALVFFGHGVGQDERCGGETHVHAPGDDDGADKGLRPVVLVDGRCGNEDRADGEGG